MTTSEPAWERDEFNVVLESAGPTKIQVIQVVRSLANVGLKEAKEVVEGAPKAVLENVTRETAERARVALEGAGATVTVK